MAEGIIEVTAGTGTKIHSWSKTVGANTVHDEFTLPGEFPYATYSVIAASISIATAADHIVQIMAGGSLNVRIRRIHIEQTTNATTAAARSFDILRLTTAGTGGSSITPAKYNTADAAAGATAMSLPSAKGTESTVLQSTTLIMRQAIATTATQPDDDYLWEQHPGIGPIVIPAGTSNGIAVKNVSATAGATVTVNIEIVETAFA